ncbi:sigma-70 family RNA polymerase sigma factor [Candidatus Sumerlaeota bacterium]|nr:sigma-70 family RNA polymerase sigma factor [Candidatus Sumerlaeota bacterium]
MSGLMQPQYIIADDNELILAAKEGDCEAFEALTQRNYRIVYSLAYAQLRDQDAAEDLVQEVFLRVYLNMDRFDPSFRFSTWITRITRNLAVDWHRRNCKHSTLAFNVPYDNVAHAIEDPDTPDLQEQLDQKRKLKILKKAMSRLKPQHREIVLLFYVNRMKKVEIAERLELHPTQVSRELDKALVMIRREALSMLNEKRPVLRLRKSSALRVMLTATAIQALMSGSRAALRAEAALYALDAPFTATLFDGPLLFKLKCALDAFLIAPLNGLKSFLLGNFVKLTALGLALLLIGAGARFLQWHLSTQPKPAVVASSASPPQSMQGADFTLSDAGSDRAVPAPAVNVNPAQGQAPSAAAEAATARNEFIAQEQNRVQAPAIQPVQVKMEPRNNRLEIDVREEFHAAARRAQCRIVSLKITGKSADAVVEGLSHSSVSDFLDELRQKGLLRRFDELSPLRATRKDGRRYYQAQYRIQW